MSDQQKAQVQQQIAQIIERSRHQEEMILIDSNSAATQIIQFLQAENLIGSFNAQLSSN